MGRQHYLFTKGLLVPAGGLKALVLRTLVVLYIIVAFFENATIEYLLESLCVCVCDLGT